MSLNQSPETIRKSVILSPDRARIIEAFKGKRVLEPREFNNNLWPDKIHAEIQSFPNPEAYRNVNFEFNEIGTFLKSKNGEEVALFHDPSPDGRDPSVIITGPHTSTPYLIVSTKLANPGIEIIHNHSFDYVAYNIIKRNLPDDISALYYLDIKETQRETRDKLIKAVDNPEDVDMVPFKEALDILSKYDSRLTEVELLEKLLHKKHHRHFSIPR